MFTALVAYQYGDMAVQMAEQLFPAVRDSEKLIPGAEIHFAEVVACCCSGFGFGRAVRERKGKGFPCALLMWWQFRRLMLEQAEQNEGNSLDFSAKALQEMVVKQLGLRFLGLSSRKTHAVILLWGLPYVYDYLYSLGLVSEGLHSGMMDKVKWVKELLLKGIGARPVAA